MKSLQQPVAGSRACDRWPNDLDGTLRAFFRAEVPEPWPVLKAPATLSPQGERPVPRTRSLLGSRFILAASLLILFLGQLFLSGMFSGYARLARDSNAGLMEATHRTAKPRAPKPVSHLKKSDARAKVEGFLTSDRH